MNGGDSNLGGVKNNLGNNTPPIAGSQPDLSVSSFSHESDGTTLSVPHSSSVSSSPQQSPQSVSLNPEPQAQPTSPVVPIQSASPSVEPQSPVASVTPQATPISTPQPPVEVPSLRGNSDSLINTGSLSQPIQPTQPVTIASDAAFLDSTTSTSYSNSGSNKRKLFFIIGAIIAVACIGIAIFFAVQGTMVANKERETKDLLNIYTNYLLYREDSSEPIDEDNLVWSPDNMAIQLEDVNPAATEEYFNTLLAYFVELAENIKNNTNLIENLGENNWQYMDTAIYNANNSLNIMVTYATMPHLSSSDMETIRLEQGAEALLARIREVYGKFIDSPDYYASRFGMSKTRMAEAINGIYAEYERLGCIKNAPVDTTSSNSDNTTEPNDAANTSSNTLSNTTSVYLDNICATEAYQNEPIVTLRSTIRTEEDVQDSALWNMEVNVISPSAMIYELLHMSPQSEEEDEVSKTNYIDNTMSNNLLGAMR